MINPARPRSTQVPPQRGRTAVRPGIIAHRLFPGLIALWFAALFGLGSLAAGADALAGLVLHAHLPAIVPAAAPPLGMTARLLAALLLAGLGGVLGLVIGLVLYVRAQRTAAIRTPRSRAIKPGPDAAGEQAPRVRSRDAHPDAPPRRPLVVTEDVLPYPTAMAAPESAPPVPVDGETVVRDEARFDSATPFALARDDEDPSCALPPFLAAARSAARRDEAPAFIAPVEPVIVPAVPEPEEADPVAVEIRDEPVAAVPLPTSRPQLASLAAAAPQVPLGEAALDSLGLVQLIERLALAIATRQARRATFPAPGSVAADAADRLPLHRFDPLTMDPTGPLLRPKPSSRAPRADLPATGHNLFPAQLHDPLAQVEDWVDDSEAQDLPPRFLGALRPGEALMTGIGADDGEPDDHAIVADRYSSLADMAMPRPELAPSLAPVVHLVDDDCCAGAADPVVQFPQRLAGGEAASTRDAQERAPGDADRALRDALATLRRMSAGR